MVEKQGMITAIAIVAFAALGGVVLIAYALPLQNSMSGTVPGLEFEQRGDVLPGDQPAAEGPSDVGALTPQEETGTAGQEKTDGNNTTGQSDTNTTDGDNAVAADNPASESDNPYSDFT